MNLTPREKDKLLVSVAAMVARRRLERGVKLNYPEAVALISDHVVESARDGRSVAELMSDGAHVVGRVAPQHDEVGCSAGPLQDDVGVTGAHAQQDGLHHDCGGRRQSSPPRRDLTRESEQARCGRP